MAPPDSDASLIARVVINERTGTIVIGQDVRLSHVLLTHANLAIFTQETPEVSQPQPFGQGETVVVPRTDVDVVEEDRPIFEIEETVTVSDLAQAHRAALAYLRQGGTSTTLNCGYGRGYSVLDTIEAVRRVAGYNFAVQYAPRRPGDIMTMIADTGRIRATLDWAPQYDDLPTIAAHALAWEAKLAQTRGGDQWQRAESA